VSAYLAPTGSVFQIGRMVFVVLDGHDDFTHLTVSGPRTVKYRRAFELTEGRLQNFGPRTGWDDAERIA